MDTESNFCFSVSAKEESLLRLFGPYESHIMGLQSVLVWEDARYSIALFFLVHLLFWLVCTVRVFYFIGILGSILVFLDMWTNHIWPGIKEAYPLGPDSEGWTPVHPRLLSVPELVSCVAKILTTCEQHIEAAVALRRHHRTKFFFKAVFILCGTATLGHYIPGIYLSYLTVMGLLVMPAAVYHNWYSRFILPYVSELERRMQIRRPRPRKVESPVPVTKTDVTDSSDDDDLAEFVPNVREEKVIVHRSQDDDVTSPDLLSLSAQADDDSLDPLDASLSPNVGEMPTHDMSFTPSLTSLLPQVSLTSTEDQDESDPKLALSELTLGDSEVTTSSSSDIIAFAHRHFDDDSSDDVSLAEGVSLPDVMAEDFSDGLQAGIVTPSTSEVPMETSTIEEAMAEAVRESREVTPCEDSLDDFEFLHKEDLGHGTE